MSTYNVCFCVEIKKYFLIWKKNTLSETIESTYSFTNFYESMLNHTKINICEKKANYDNILRFKYKL